MNHKTPNNNELIILIMHFHISTFIELRSYSKQEVSENARFGDVIWPKALC